MVDFRRNHYEISLTNTLKFCGALMMLGIGIDKMYILNETVHNIEGALVGRFASAILIFGGMLCLLPKSILKFGKVRYLFLLPLASLVYYNAVKFEQSGYVFEQIVEHSLQLFIPIALIWTLGEKRFRSILMEFLKITLSLTFIGHACFAVGVHYVPSNFLEMTMSIFSCSETTALNFLMLAGILDVLAAIALYSEPTKKLGFGLYGGMGIVNSICETGFSFGRRTYSFFLFSRFNERYF